MAQDIVVTIVHRDSTGREDLIRLRARENRPPPAGAADSARAPMAPEVKRHVMEYLMSQDGDNAVQSKLRDLTNPDVFQQGGNLVVRPLQPKARKIPTSCAVSALPGGLGDAVPPLTFTRNTDLSLDCAAESMVCFGVKRSEAQFVTLYLSDVVEEAAATGAAKSVQVSLDAMNVTARVERTAPDDRNHPDQLRVLIIMAVHDAPGITPPAPSRRAQTSASAA